MWLNQAWLSQTLSNRVFHIELIGVSEDAVSVRLRSEIAQWLHLPLVTSAPQSTQPTVTLVCDVRSCLDEEGFSIDVAQDGNVCIESSSTRGLLYGFYAWLRDVGLKAEHSHTEIPDQKLRMINQWIKQMARLNEGMQENPSSTDDGEATFMQSSSTFLSAAQQMFFAVTYLEFATMRASLHLWESTPSA